MGSDNLFHKVREERKKRETNIINQRAGNWLIVTEGTKTEPIYFKRIISFSLFDVKNRNSSFFVKNAVYPFEMLHFITFFQNRFTKL